MTEIHEHRPARLGQDHVARLDIAMDHRVLVRVRQRFGHARDDVGHLTPVRTAAAQPVVQRRSVEQVRDDEALAVVDADVEDSDDAGVAKAGEIARLAQEDVLGIAGQELRGRHLDGHFAVEVRVVASVNGGKAAAAAHTAHLVAAERRGQLRTDRGVGGRGVGGGQVSRLIEEVRRGVDLAVGPLTSHARSPH
jgi:hypothetical protein